MNKENATKLWKIIQEAGDFLIKEQQDQTLIKNYEDRYELD